MISQVAIGLKKQTEGDPDWDDGLNSGFDDANTRLTLSGTTPPTGTVPGFWVGQQYVQLLKVVGTPPVTTGVALWACSVATGVPATTVWVRHPMQLDATSQRPVWQNVGGFTQQFPARPMVARESVGTVETGLGGGVANPVAVITPPVAPQHIGNEFIFLLLATAIAPVAGNLEFQISWNAGSSWTKLGHAWPVTANTPAVIHYLGTTSPQMTAGVNVHVRLGGFSVAIVAQIDAMFLSKFGATS